MDYLIFFLIILISLLIFRSIKKYYLSINNSNLNSKKVLIISQIVHFISKECRFLIYLYMGLVGLYVLIERIYKYNIFPANLPSLKSTFLFIHNMNSNDFIMEMYSLSILIYLVIILPYRLVKLYDKIINITDTKDYIHTFIKNHFNKFKLWLNSKGG